MATTRSSVVPVDTLLGGKSGGTELAFWWIGLSWVV